MGVKLSYFYSVTNFVDSGGHCVIRGAEAAADLSDIAAAAAGCEGCFHSTAATLFLRRRSSSPEQHRD